MRFDLAVQCLGDYKILSPIREIQKITTQVRDYEQTFLKDRGFAIPDKVAQYSINENLLGTTISGSEIDKWQVPSDASYVLTKPSHLVNQEPKTLSLEFKQGQVIAIDTKEFDTNIVGDDLSDGGVVVDDHAVGLSVLGVVHGLMLTITVAPPYLEVSGF